MPLPLPRPARTDPGRTSPVLRTLLSGVLSVLVAIAVVGSPSLTLPAAAAGRVPAGATGLPSGIEGLARYVPNNSCTPGERVGTGKLAALLRRTYGVGVGTFRACNGSVSEHHDGRAVDVMLSVRKSAQKQDATALISWLLATDSKGNRYANARRLGVMYIIWNGRIWASYRTGDGWRDYQGCSKLTATGYDTACHRDHVHLSLSWEGAVARTSFWSRKVAVPRYGACVGTGMRWAGNDDTPSTSPCGSSRPLSAPSGSSATYRALVPWAGYYLKSGGATGTPVRAWQQGLGIPTTGTWDTRTRDATKAFQARKKLPTSGTANLATWRALLAQHAPR